MSRKKLHSLHSLHCQEKETAYVYYDLKKKVTFIALLFYSGFAEKDYLYKK